VRKEGAGRGTDHEQSARSAGAGVELGNIKETQSEKKKTSHPARLTQG
jgi:hypothetical protein